MCVRLPRPGHRPAKTVSSGSCRSVDLRAFAPIGSIYGQPSTNDLQASRAFVRSFLRSHVTEVAAALSDTKESPETIATLRFLAMAAGEDRHIEMSLKKEPDLWAAVQASGTKEAEIVAARESLVARAADSFTDGLALALSRLSARQLAFEHAKADPDLGLSATEGRYRTTEGFENAVEESGSLRRAAEARVEEKQASYDSEVKQLAAWLNLYPDQLNAFLQAPASAALFEELELYASAEPDIEKALVTALNRDLVQALDSAGVVAERNGRPVQNSSMTF